ASGALEQPHPARRRGCPDRREAGDRPPLPHLPPVPQRPAEPAEQTPSAAAHFRRWLAVQDARQRVFGVLAQLLQLVGRPVTDPLLLAVQLADQAIEEALGSRELSP